jgi:hypothetical protein
MEKNDETMSSREDDTLPADNDERLPHDSAEQTASAAEPASELPEVEIIPPVSAKTIAFPGPKTPPVSKLEPAFGMPELDFFAAQRSGEDERPDLGAASSPADIAETDAPGALLPPGDGTGWESGETINKPASLRARIEMQEAEHSFDSMLFANDDLPDDDGPGRERPRWNEANITPFPGTTLNRAFDAAPLELGRSGGTSASIFGEISARAAEDQGGPAFDPAPGRDTLADAVQSALRNVYGGYSEPQDEQNDAGGYTVAEALGAAEQTSQPSWGDDRTIVAEWRDPEPDDDDAERQAPHETSAEAVFDYLYQQRRQESGGFAAQDPSLTDFGGRNSLNDDWRDDDDDADESRVTPFPDREHGDAYRGRIADLQAAASAEPSPHFFQDTALRPSLDDKWGDQPYAAPQNARGSITPTYAPAIATPADPLGSQGPDSGHLLGAAGLGLIGGIALAGVLAVFVFNSFVDESGQAIPDQGAKVVERLAPASATSPADTRSAPAAAPEIRVQTAPQQPSAASATQQLRSAPSAEPQRSAAVAPAETAPPAAGQNLTASAVSGAPDSPIRLAIAVADSNLGDALISLKGLPKDAKLSTGIDVGGGQWLLPPNRLKDLTLTAPATAVGNYQLEAQLLKDDAQTSMSPAVPFNLSIAASAPRAASAPAQPASAAPPAPPSRVAGVAATPTVAPAQQRADTARLAALPDEAPQPDTDFLTQMLIRDGNKKMREGDITAARKFYEQAAASGHPEASLAMGRSYDPTYFERLNVKTGKPDPATAFEWYKKALDGGLVTAKVKIDALKQWLQR